MSKRPMLTAICVGGPLDGTSVDSEHLCPGIICDGVEYRYLDLWFFKDERRAFFYVLKVWDEGTAMARAISADPLTLESRLNPDEP